MIPNRFVALFQIKLLPQMLNQTVGSMTAEKCFFFMQITLQHFGNIHKTLWQY